MQFFFEYEHTFSAELAPFAGNVIMQNGCYYQCLSVISIQGQRGFLSITF